MNPTNSLKENIMTAFFAAAVFLGIHFFRIPMPAAVGTPFLHFSHIIAVLALTCLGTGRALLAVLSGFLLFDVLNGYIAAIPNVLFSTIVNCLATGTVYSLLVVQAEGSRKKEWIAAFKSAALYGALNVLIDLAWNSWWQVQAGGEAREALAASFISIPATLINSVIAVSGVLILYFPVRAVYKLIVR